MKTLYIIHNIIYLCLKIQSTQAVSVILPNMKPSIPYMDILNFQELMSVKKWNVTYSESLIAIFNFWDTYTGNMTYECQSMLQIFLHCILLYIKHYYYKVLN